MTTLEKLRDLADRDHYVAEQMLTSGAFPEELLGELMDRATGNDVLLLVGLAKNPHLSAFEVRSLVAASERVSQEKSDDPFPLDRFVMRELAYNPSTPLNLVIEAKGAFDGSIIRWADCAISHPNLPVAVYRRLVQAVVDDTAPAITGDLGTIFTAEDLSGYFVSPGEPVPSVAPFLRSRHFATLDEDLQFLLLSTSNGSRDNWTLRWSDLPDEVAPSVLADLHEMLLHESHPYFDHALSQVVNHPRFPEDALHQENLAVDFVDGELCVSDRALRLLMSSRSQSDEVMGKVHQLVSHAQGSQFIEVLSYGFGFDDERFNGTPRSEATLLEVLHRLERDPKHKHNFTRICSVVSAILTNPGVTPAVVDKIAQMIPAEDLSSEECPNFGIPTVGSVIMHPQLSEKVRAALLQHDSGILAEMAHFQDFGALPQSPDAAQWILLAQLAGTPSRSDLGGGTRGRTESVHQKARVGMQWLELLWKHMEEVTEGPDAEEWFTLVGRVAELMLADNAEGHDWKRLAVLLGVVGYTDGTMSFS